MNCPRRKARRRKRRLALLSSRKPPPHLSKNGGHRSLCRTALAALAAAVQADVAELLSVAHARRRRPQRRRRHDRVRYVQARRLQGTSRVPRLRQALLAPVRPRRLIAVRRRGQDRRAPKTAHEGAPPEVERPRRRGLPRACDGRYSRPRHGRPRGGREAARRGRGHRGGLDPGQSPRVQGRQGDQPAAGRLGLVPRGRREHHPVRGLLAGAAVYGQAAVPDEARDPQGHPRAERLRERPVGPR